MNEQMSAQLMRKIDQAGLVSFDIFDTLLFRKTNSPEVIFDLVGKHFGIHGFRKLRMDEQNEASRRAYASHRYPHADMDQIYAVLAEHTEIPVNWDEVKDYEIQMERDALVANEELLEVFRYAKTQGKRVVAVSDMYLPAAVLSSFLEEKGFVGFDYVYCSADEHKAKFNRDLFELVAEKEQIPYEEILHIGDKDRDDGEFPEAYGIKTFIYRADADLEKVKNAGGTDVDKGLYKILADTDRGFWYNLGVEVGGPIYLGLYRYVADLMAKRGKKIYFLARDGYNLYRLFKENGYDNIEYLYTSRRALLLAAIKEMNDQDIRSLPPYTYGQTVGEIFDYLGVDRAQIRGLETIGFTSFDDVIRTEEQVETFKQIYRINRDVFLARCEKERRNAKVYFESVGFLSGDALCFDCGWQGSSQELIERFKRAIGCEVKHEFIYFGIKNGQKSRTQLLGMHYQTYLFDFYTNYALQADLHRNVALYELFFSAPHESIYTYGDQGSLIFEPGEGTSIKEELLAGIRDFVQLGMEFVEKYEVEYTPEMSVGHLKRLIHFPTEEEAVKIGNLTNVDGFARKQGMEKYIAYATQEQLAENPNFEVYWPEGFLTRPDIPDEVKKELASRHGMVYPKVFSEYHLEDERDIRSYYRFIRNNESERQPEKELNYRPKFSVVIPVYNTVTEQLEECIRSVLGQSYDNFQLILVDDHSTWENVVPVLQSFETDPRVRVIYRSTNGHISVATNDGIAMADGDYIVFMDCDDTIERDALYSFAEKLNENPELDFLYSDEDKITEDGRIRHLPFFKPKWSPDLFMNMMYTNHLGAYRTSIVKAVGGLRTAYNGSQDYDFTLRFMERSDNRRVGHIPKVLYHWRERKESVAYAMNSKNYASEAARYAKEDYIRRNGIKAHLEPIDGMCQHRIVYEVVGEPLVSIIIPSKDQPGILRRCIDSILEFTTYRKFEFVVVDNGSSGDSRRQIEPYLAEIGATYVYEKRPFNFSHMCNLGAAHAKGEYLLFLNDDVEMFQPEWLGRMLGHAQRDHVGAVGAKLLYPLSSIIQHAGVSNPVNGPLHSFMKLDDAFPYYFGWNRVDGNCICVTGACLLVNADKFREVGGYDEALPVAYNDVKLCFELHRRGYYHVVRNDVVAYHYESLSRGSDHVEDEKLIRLSMERTGLFADFPELFNRDPYLNINLSGYSDRLELKRGFDELREMDLRGCLPGGGVSIDHVEVTDRVRIVGWSVPLGDTPVEEQERYLIMKDPFGRTYGTKTLPFARPDVAEHFGREDYRYAGFEGILRNTQLRVDLMPYQVGIVTVLRDGTRYLAWCENTTPVIRKPKPNPYGLDWERTDTIGKGARNQVQWYLDACERNSGYHRIRGFAFKRGIDHMKYGTTLVLRTQGKEAYEFDVHSEERIDVAYSFVKEYFLFNTGFLCYVYDRMLKPGNTYEVIIRLRNRFVEDDVLDVPTGATVTV